MKPKSIILTVLLFIAASAALFPNLATAAPPEDYVVVPLGAAQDDTSRRAVYEKLFEYIYAGKPVHLAAQSFTHNGADYAPGSLIAPATFTGTFTATRIATLLPLTESYALHYRPIAIFRSDLQDENGYDLTSAAARYESILNAGYLNGTGRYYDMLNETAIISGALTADEYGLLLIPKIKKGYVADVVDALGEAGLTALAEFVQDGGMIYAEGDGAHVVEAAELVPERTIDLENRVTAYDTDNVGHLTVSNRELPLTWNWLKDEVYVLDDPVLWSGGPSGIAPEIICWGIISDGTWHCLPNSTRSLTDSLQIVATYTNTTRPNTSAILHRQYASGGQIVLYSGHPSSHPDYIPQFLAAVLQSFADRVELTASATHPFSGTAAADVIPGREADIPVNINVWLEPTFPITLTDVVITETIQPGFYISETLLAALTPSAVVTNNQIVWTIAEIAPGAPFTVTFPVFTHQETLSQSVATVSTGYATYHDSGRVRRLEHLPLRITALMAARLCGDCDIEPDRVFYIPAEGNVLDVYHLYENKEETMARNIHIMETIPLIVPIVDLEDQTRFLDNNQGETIWVLNEPFFYDEPSYPRPLGFEEFTATHNIPLTYANTVAVYEVPGGVHTDPPMLHGLGNFVTIPPTYSQYITVTPDHKLIVPALRLEWDLYDWPGYHYEEPAIRYGIVSRELLGREVYFDRTPREEPAVTVQYGGGSIYTLVGGAPVFYRQELDTGQVVYWPESADVSRVEYEDIWGRTFTMPLRAAFYDVFDADACACGPGIKEHHVGLAGTFGLWVDQNDDGTQNDLVKEYASKLPARVDWLVRARGLADLPTGETLLDIAIPRPFRTQIAPASGDWRDSYEVETGAAEFVTISETNSLTHLFFHVELNPNEPTAIRFHGVITPFANFHPDNVAVKLAEGPFLTYRQEVAGPSRYEVVFGHVQGVRAHAKNIALSKQVYPSVLSVHGDEFYYEIEIEDSSAENRYLSDPYFASYGYDTLAYTVYVGGRDNIDNPKRILHSVLRPSGTITDYTFIRYEVTNNTGDALTQVNIAPDTAALPPGVTVTQILVPQVPPQFPELPFLNVETILDAWRGIYYFRLEVNDTFPEELRGRALTVPFTISSPDLPATATLPLPLYGVVDVRDAVETAANPAQELVLTDTLPAFVNLEDVRIANPTEVITLNEYIKTDHISGTVTARDYYTALRTGALTTCAPLSETALYTFTLTDTAAELPWNDAGVPNATMALILRGTTGEMRPGRYLANAGAQLSYREAEGRQEFTAPSNVIYFEIHGAHITTTYRVAGMSRVFNGDELTALFPGEANEVELLVETINDGDDLALDLTITTTLPPSITLATVSLAPRVTVSGQNIIWQVGDLADGAAAQLTITLQLTPTVQIPAPGATRVEPTAAQFTLMNAAASRFTDEFSAKTLVLDATPRLDVATQSSVLIAPPNLTVTWPVQGWPFLRWDAVAGEEVIYYVYRSTNPHTGFELLHTVDTATNQTDYYAHPGMRYYYAVVAASDLTDQGLHSNIVGVGESRIYLPLILKNG